MKNIIITILVVLVLGLGGYLVYDKVINVEENLLNNNEQNNVQDTTNDVVIEKKDAAYFDEYLKVFTKTCEGRKIAKNTENFSNEDISSFVLGYYGEPGNLTYNVGVSHVNELIYKYFNKKDAVLEAKPYGSEVATITKQDNIYKFTWSEVGCDVDEYVNPVVTYEGENVTVKYEIYAHLGCIDEEDCGLTGKYITFHLKYNNGNYNVIKIEG